MKLAVASLVLILIGAMSFTPSWAAEQDAVRKIKIYRAGSSSFPNDIIEDARRIAESSGKYQLICDAQEDSSGYVRLDEFLTRPGLQTEWTEQFLPRIAAGKYDFVVFQTIDWLRHKPEHQERLCTQILPELFARIRDTGAKVVLYDKYIPLERDQNNPKARTWSYRYPDGEQLNYLLHIVAAKKAGVSAITFSGAAVNELWNHELFRRMDFLYAGGHPGVFANYITAVNLAYIFTGEDPVGNPARELLFEGWPADAFKKLTESNRGGDRRLYEDNIGRIKGNTFVLRDNEAQVMQKAAMASHRKWTAIMQENLNSDEVFARTLRDIKAIQAEVDKYEQYGLDARRIATLKRDFAEAAEPGGVKPADVDAIRRQSRSIRYADAELRKIVDNLPGAGGREVQQAYSHYWETNNSKLRDDVYYEGRMREKKLENAGDRDEYQRVHMTVRMINYVLAIGGYKALLEHVDDKLRSDILSKYRVSGPEAGNSPAFAAYQSKFQKDYDKLVRGWDVYLEIWENPELLDRLKTENFPLSIINEVDKEFQQRISRQDKN